MKMTKATYLIAALAIFSLPAQAIAAEQTKCVKQNEIADLAIYLIPGAMEQGISECTQFLPTDAALLTEGPKALERYKNDAVGIEGKASKVVGTFVGDQMQTGMAEAFALPLIQMMVAGGIAGELDAKGCNIFNNVWAPMSSLSSAQIASTVIAIAQAAQDKSDDKETEEASDDELEKTSKGRFDDFNICPFMTRSGN